MRPQLLVLFGATGDLARRSLYPSLYRLRRDGELHEDTALVGSGRSVPDGGDDGFRDQVRQAVRDAVGDVDEAVLDAMVRRVSFRAADADDAGDLAGHVRERAGQIGSDRTVLYLSLPTEAVPAMAAALDAQGLLDDAALVVEKPFGHDLPSSRDLADRLARLVPEERTFRVDHFLQMSDLTDALDPSWDHGTVEQVQVDVPETLRTEGRGSFYEQTGCLRDMVVDHLLAMVTLAAADGAAGTGDEARDARVALLQHVRPLEPSSVVLGQYDGYRDEDDVDPDSQVETLVAATVVVGSDRWRGVPFHLRTGKAMADDGPTVTVVLRAEAGDEQVDAVVDLADALAGAYDDVLRDVLAGDSTRFVRRDEVDLRWQVCQPVLDHRPEPEPYAAGGWGPSAALDLPGGGWRRP